MKRSLILVVAVALVAGACRSGTAGTSSTTTARASTTTTSLVPATTTTSAPSVTPATTTTIPAVPVEVGLQPRTLGPFAPFTAVPLLDTGTYPGPPTPDSLDEVAMPGWMAEWLDTTGAAETLVENGFVVLPDRTYRLFHQPYESILYDATVAYVTTDVAYHSWHLVFSKVLRETEQQVLLPILEELISGLVDDSRAQNQGLAGTAVAEAADRVEQFYEAAATLLGLDVGPIGPLAQAEVELALAHSQMTASPITSFHGCDPTFSPAGCVDYTQFKPRGHYTRNEELERYFRAMSLLGQTSFFLSEPESLRLGILAARPLVTNPERGQGYNSIFNPTAFMVGMADDYMPHELISATETFEGTAMEDPVVLAADDLIEDIAAGLLALRDVGINPEAAGMRIMGARFVVDSYILDQLAWPNVGVEGNQRVKVSPLDLAAAFGSDFAHQIQLDAGESDFENYDEQLAKMQALIAGREGDDWATTVYDAWLYAIEPMWQPHGTAFPEYMRTEAWAAKSHQTGFGSYTELKHDTLLYAKQGFAAEGGGEAPVVPPRHWVEPDPVAFERISAMAKLLQDGLSSSRLLTAEQEDLLTLIRVDFLDRLARIARNELGGSPISDADNEWLGFIGSTLELIWLESSDIDPQLVGPSSSDQDAALIADVFRSSFEVLELGSGRPNEMLILVPTDDGVFQVATGAVYSYYEFWAPASNRLTDEEWRAMLDAGEQPDRTQPLVLDTTTNRQRRAWQAVLFPGD
ncbi:MAG: DUF3160 domain-containing protein [Acidimicrobiia bacterium]|nr:DUF3160 domain-containing protein [Acidimicrobiia bacterium]